MNPLTEFRGSRPANIIAALIILGLGVFNIIIEPGQLTLAFGSVLVCIGLMGLFYQILGESVPDAIRRMAG